MYVCVCPRVRTWMLPPLTTVDYVMSFFLRECGEEQHGGRLPAAASQMRRNPAWCHEVHKINFVFVLFFLYVIAIGSNEGTNIEFKVSVTHNN